MATNPQTSAHTDDVTQFLALRLNRTSRLVFAVVTILLALGGLMPIASGITLPGEIAVDGARSQIQHINGGIIRSVHVREGAQVRKGDLLFRLDSSQNSSEVAVIENAVRHLEVSMAVSEAEMAGAAKFTPAAAGISGATLAAARQTFDLRRAARLGEIAQLKAQIESTDALIRGNTQQIRAIDDQMRLTESETADLRRLFEKGLIQKTRLNAAERAIAEMSGRRAFLVANQGEMNARRREISARLRNIDEAVRADAAEQLQRAALELGNANERLSAARAEQARSNVLAPADGTIIGLRARTPGEVVLAGEILAEVVPRNPGLVIVGRLPPQYAEVIKVGMPATVRFRTIGPTAGLMTAGRITRLSAAASTDPQTGARFFEVEVRILDSDRIRRQAVSVRPGLPVDILAETGSQTALAYLFAPISRASFQAMREP